MGLARLDRDFCKHRRFSRQPAGSSVESVVWVQCQPVIAKPEPDRLPTNGIRTHNEQMEAIILDSVRDELLTEARHSALRVLIGRGARNKYPWCVSYCLTTYPIITGGTASAGL